MNDPLPAYAFVPGGPFRHPKLDAVPEPRPEPIAGGDWRASRSYLHGFSLFDAGFYWEAHEEWEGLWHAHGRTGSIANLLKGLIKLAAAGVKVRQGQRHGVVTHATRAGACFAAARREAGRVLLGMDLERLESLSRAIADKPPATSAGLEVSLARVFEFTLTLEENAGTRLEETSVPA